MNGDSYTMTAVRAPRRIEVFSMGWKYGIGVGWKAIYGSEIIWQYMNRRRRGEF
jgi:hypothetical protein